MLMNTYNKYTAYKHVKKADGNNYQLHYHLQIFII